jgi:enamine deaminase RidA (YjgF/YER057c/UK114 family)
MSAEERLKELGLELPPPVAPVAAYLPAVRAGDLVFVSGQLPFVAGKLPFTGKVGAGVSLETAKGLANIACLNGLSALRAEAGSLDRVARIVRVGVFVASAPGFTEQPQVANGASELLVELFGDSGRHARAAVGVAELPLGAPVEVEMLALLHTGER